MTSHDEGKALRKHLLMSYLNVLRIVFADVEAHLKETALAVRVLNEQFVSGQGIKHFTTSLLVVG